jgi:hypothetical protein
MFVLPWVAWKLQVEAAEAIQRTTAPALQVEIPMTSMSTWL